MILWPASSLSNQSSMLLLFLKCKFDLVSLLLKILHLLLITFRIKSNLFSMSHKVLYDLAPIYHSALIILSGWNHHTHPTSRPPPPHTLPTQSSWSFLPFGSESSRSLLRACGLQLHICTHICHSTHHISEQLSLSDSVNQFWVVEAQRYIFYFGILQFSSVQSLSRVWLFATPWTAHAGPPCPSPTPGVRPNPWPLSRWCHPTISSSVVPFSSCPQFFPASGSFQMSQLFTLGGQSIGVSASTSVPPMNTQDWSPLGWTGWISLQSKGLSRVFSSTTVQKHQFFCAQLSL